MKKNTLAEHNIKFLFWSKIFGSILFITPVLTLFYFSRGLDERLILLVMVFFSLGVLIGEVPTGIFADRFGAKMSFLIGSLLGIGSHALLLWAYEPWVFFLSSLLTGFAATFFSGSDEALIYESLILSNEENKMDRAMGQIDSAKFLVTIIVVIIGAILAKDLSDGQFKLLIVLSLFFMSLQFTLLLFIKNPPNQGTYQNDIRTQLKEGFFTIKKHPQVLWMFMNITLVFIPATAIFEKFDQKLLVDAGLPVYSIGIVYASAALIGFTASRTIGWMTERISRVHLLFITGLLAVLGLIGIATFTSYLGILLGILLILKLVSAIRYPVYSQLSNEIIPSNVRATTISLLSILDSGFDIIIFLTVSGMAITGFSMMFFVCAGIALIGTLLPVFPKKV
ncbi:Predicted arabinose efflux permease, MFS family [Gracilibacillus orientalis]|uniref:Predicted arabinose efflux permease, MFS family n=1 Tax=Gracilibacillus orientalis TaxID=334253 RepID=A0A1I4IY51_9BACI|nr:MFS transporter [Gracilibacillus orientalis]SFL58923.1 Predicted arabinose efflux permease, MFS family [Gracilibacillus orientalis]